MKKTIWIFFLYVFATAILPSCKKAETEPRDLTTYDLIFDPVDLNADQAQLFFNNIFTFLPSGFNRVSGDFLDAASGDAVSLSNNTPISYFYNGIISATNNPDSYFSNSYNGIRQVNIFLANIDKVPVPTTNTNRTIIWKAEVRFIRAFLYFELLKRYGGVPLIGDQVFTLDDNLQLKRNTYAECVDYIASECDAIKTQLYADPVSSTNLGHIPRGAAIALKSRLYLYAASPLFNGGGIEPDPALRALTGYPSFDATRWATAAAAAQELMNLNVYNLGSATGKSAYINIFTTKQNSEVILAKQAANDFNLETSQAPTGYILNNSQSKGGTNPTQDFVDAFTTSNGLPISQDPLYSAAAPYNNRDPRLAASVFYNGSQWINRAVETFEGGKDKPNVPSVIQTRTGYYLRKFLADFSSASSYSNQSHNFIYFRYAEILLNYAEAINEVSPTNTETAVAQIILIRKRAGINAGANSRYGIPVGISQLDLRILIQNERRIELSFEEHRFWDLRRWKIANTELNKTLSGIRITKDVNGNLTYQTVPVLGITFQNKLYHMPFPYDETAKDANLQQNFGW